MSGTSSGGCLCGAVRYEVAGPMRNVAICHCGQCQRTHGGPASYAAAKKADLKLTEERGLAWYESTPGARRGFCKVCGGRLFWDKADNDYVAVAAGTIDAPTGLKTVRHIFVASKPDYYEIADGLEQLPEGHAAAGKQ